MAIGSPMWKLFKLFIVLILVGFVVILWVNQQLKKSSGSFTDLIDVHYQVKSFPKIVIQDVNILSEDCTHFLAHQNVVLEDGLIKSIHNDSLLDDGYTVVDGQNKYLIPGLVDSHVHLRDSKNDLFLYLANGVTFIREMSGNAEHLKWKKEIADGALGPRMYVASEKIHSKSGFTALFDSWTRNRINFSTQKAAVQKIKQLHKMGFDAVKISTFLNKEMHKATIAEAKKYNIPVIGHIPLSIGLDSIYNSGQCELAHVEEITKDLIRQFGRITALNANEFLIDLEEQSDKISKKLREENIAVTTTIWLMESLPEQKFNLEAFIKNINLEYVNPGIIEGTRLSKGWLPGYNSYEEPEELLMNADSRKNAEVFWETYVKAIHIMTKALAKNDIFIMAGTDANVPVTVPGFSLHDELTSLSKSGMTNSQVLFSATTAPGIWMASNTGKIKEGYAADLVLLLKNPLDNIENTTTIESVFCKTFWLTAENKNSILNKIVNINEENRNIDITSLVY